MWRKEQFTIVMCKEFVMRNDDDCLGCSQNYGKRNVYHKSIKAGEKESSRGIFVFQACMILCLT